MFITVLFILDRNQKQPSQVLMKNIGKPWCVQTIEYYSAIERNELLIHTAWMNLKHFYESKKLYPEMYIP